MKTPRDLLEEVLKMDNPVVLSFDIGSYAVDDCPRVNTEEELQELISTKDIEDYEVVELDRMIILNSPNEIYPMATILEWKLSEFEVGIHDVTKYTVLRYPMDDEDDWLDSADYLVLPIINQTQNIIMKG